MAYVDKVLIVRERIEQRPQFSRFAAYGAPLVEFFAVAFVWSVLRWILIGVVFPVEGETEQWFLVGYVVGLALFGVRFGWRMGVRFVKLMFSELAVTNLRFMEKEGVLDVRFWATDLEKIQRVEIKQPLLGRLFDYGDITIVTVGEVTHTTRAVEAPIQLQQALHARMSAAASRAAPAAVEPVNRVVDA